jgi:hypothetical protein
MNLRTDRRVMGVYVVVISFLPAMVIFVLIGDVLIDRAHRSCALILFCLAYGALLLVAGFIAGDGEDDQPA